MLALDLGGYGIRVNGVAPGVTATPLQDASPAEAVSALAARSALKRVGTPEEIANVVLFLLSDLASYVTAHTVVADGGLYGVSISPHRDVLSSRPGEITGQPCS